MLLCLIFACILSSVTWFILYTCANCVVVGCTQYVLVYMLHSYINIHFMSLYIGYDIKKMSLSELILSRLTKHKRACLTITSSKWRRQHCFLIKNFCSNTIDGEKQDWSFILLLVRAWGRLERYQQWTLARSPGSFHWQWQRNVNRMYLPFKEFFRNVSLIKKKKKK